MAEKKWGQKGGPWEFNLRDLFRWCQLMLVDQSPGCYDPGQHVFLVYGERMRTREDKEKVSLVFSFLALQIVRKYFQKSECNLKMLCISFIGITCYKIKNRIEV